MNTKDFYTAINTKDMEKSLDFYTRILDFRIVHNIQTPAGRIVILENDKGAHLELMSLPKEAGFHALRTNVADLDAAIKELTENGYEIINSKEISTGKAIVVKDPNGVLIDITQHIKK